MPPRIGYYGDDFTGATDTLTTATQAGLRTVLFSAPPTQAQLDAAGPLDCLGIAGAARSMAPDAEMAAELAPVGAFFAESRRAGRALQNLLDLRQRARRRQHRRGGGGAAPASIANPFVPIVGGQPNLGRYCLFGNLFAAAESRRRRSTASTGTRR